MATYKSNLVTAGTPAKTGIETVQQIATYTVATGLAAADVIEMIPVPKGARVTDISILASGSLGATLTASVGDDGDADRFAVAAAFGQGSSTFTRMGVGGGAASLGYAYTASNTIDITIATAATPTTGQTITMVASYVMGDVSI